jgi:hypothetical protein
MTDVSRLFPARSAALSVVVEQAVGDNTIGCQASVVL